MAILIERPTSGSATVSPGIGARAKAGGRRLEKGGLLFIAVAAILVAAGCARPVVTDLGGTPDGGGGGGGGGGGSAVTFYKDVLPVVYDKCFGCHQTGGAAFPMDTYADVQPIANVIANAIAAGDMPPWPPDPACHHYRGERTLSDAQKNAILTWNATGAVEGDPADAPAKPAPAVNPLGISDRALDPGGDYSFDPNASTDLYWCFRLDPQITAPTDFIGADIAPGNKEIVHHVIVFREANGAGKATGVPGFQCDGAPGEFLFAWVPGSSPLVFPQGVGMQLQPTDRLLMQIHYHRVPNAASQVDRTKALMWFAHTPVSQRAMVSWLGTPAINIPANSTNVTASGQCTVPGSADGAKLLSVAPHMHTLATKFNSTLTSGGGDQCLVDIPKWSFGWQGGYQYEQPITLHGGDTITSTCTWDNPTTSTVKFGEGTGSEMCFNFVYVVDPSGTFPRYCFPGGGIFGIFANGGLTP